MHYSGFDSTATLTATVTSLGFFLLLSSSPLCCLSSILLFCFVQECQGLDYALSSEEPPPGKAPPTTVQSIRMQPIRYIRPLTPL